ncbi:unnamed protein product [Danaus chrysippus]|uniref:(African queen) hypothetical protein n=1 Tax=Danaus chrysippus TaxID=151541 RepID=A0A8J2QJU0_9NEOP|nr:unnamed protein product [Danaus chrysippus]
MCINAFSVQNLFSAVARERCLAKFKKFRIQQTNKKATEPSTSAAILIPLCIVNDIPSLLYTVRAVNLKTDSGHISFPGGKTDKGESPVETALRETREEIGLSPEKVDIWGSGNTFPGRNNKISVTPVIGSIKNLTEQDLSLNKKEVAETFAVPLQTFCDPNNQFYTQFKNGYILPVFVVNKYQIWGLTAYVTHVFLSCLLSKDLYRNEWMAKKIFIDHHSNLQ